MANKKISELEQAQAVLPNDLLAIVQNVSGTQETRKVKVEELLASCSGGSGNGTGNLDFVKVKYDAEGSIGIRTRIIRVPRSTKGLVISLYSAVYYSRVNTYQEFIIDGSLPVEDIVQTKIVDRFSWSGGPNGQAFIFSVDDNYIDIIVDFGRDVAYKPRVLFNPNGVEVNMTAVDNYPYGNETYVPHTFYQPSIDIAVEPKVDKYCDFQSAAGSGNCSLRRIAKIPTYTAPSSVSTVVISLYAKAYTGSIYDAHALGYKAYEEIIIDTTQENINRDEVVQTTVGGSVVYWQIINNYVEVYLQNASGAANYYVTRVLFNPNKIGVDLSQEDTAYYYTEIKKAKNIYDYKQNAVDQAIDYSINNGNKSIVGAINWLAQQIGQGGGGFVENFPLSIAEGGQNINPGFYGVRFTPGTDFVAKYAQICKRDNMTSGTFVIAIYTQGVTPNGSRTENMTLLAQTSPATFAGDNGIATGEFPPQQQITLEADKEYYMVLYVQHSADRGLICRRTAANNWGDSNLTLAFKGSFQTVQSTLGSSNFSTLFPGSSVNEIVMPYMKIYG